jgi:hypothetical protein
MHRNHTTTAGRVARSIAIGAGSGLLLLAGASPALADDPLGNNGTIKVDDVELDAHPHNEPHVGCTFQVDFYGFDEGDLFADVTFEAHAPTEGGVLLTDSVFIGEDGNEGAATPEGLDAAVDYDLTEALADIEPAAQGHHVKLTIEADGSQGAPVKHKVFWVEGCTPVTEEQPPVVEEEPPVVEVAPLVDPADPAEVLGTTVTAPATLPRTGTGTAALAAAGTMLVALGLMARLLGTRLAAR